MSDSPYEAWPEQAIPSFEALMPSLELRTRSVLRNGISQKRTLCADPKQRPVELLSVSLSYPIFRLTRICNPHEQNVMAANFNRHVIFQIDLLARPQVLAPLRPMQS